MPIAGPDSPATKRDIQRLVAAIMASTSDYITADEFRQLIGMGRTRFSQLMTMGRFDKGILPATKSRKTKMIHRYYNPETQIIELPGLGDK